MNACHMDKLMNACHMDKKAFTIYCSIMYKLVFVEQNKLMCACN